MNDILARVQTRQAIYCKEMIGKTIASIHTTGEYLLMRFTDDTWAALINSSGPYQDQPTIEVETDTPEPSYLVEVGLITESERDAIYAERRAARLIEEEARDRKQYEALQKRFG